MPTFPGSWVQESFDHVRDPRPAGVGGGAAFFKSSPIERAYRDIRAAKFHPFNAEATLIHAGQLALGVQANTA